jgi:hypothetical protein
MAKNLSHLSNIHEAANSLHRLLVGSPGYLNIQVMSAPETKGPVTKRQESREIVVFVRSKEHVLEPTIYNSWPVRYEVGSG